MNTPNLITVESPGSMMSRIIVAAFFVIAVSLNSQAEECACLEAFSEDSSHLMTREVMQAMADRFGPENATFEPHFDPDQDFGGPYAFSIPLGRFEEDMNGATITSTAQLSVALRRLVSREQIESDQHLMRDLELDSDDDLIEAVARAPMGQFGEPYDYEEVDGPGDLAIFHRDPEPMLFIACGNALMELAVGRHQLPENPPEDAAEAFTASELEIMSALAEKLIKHCSTDQ